jgi:hypothetical protein
VSEYAKGPWESGSNPTGTFTNEIVVRPRGEFPHGEWIADCGSRHDAERVANARLMAAAPEMAEMLKGKVLAALRQPQAMDIEGVCEDVEELLRKAGVL